MVLITTVASTTASTNCQKLGIVSPLSPIKSDEVAERHTLFGMNPEH